VELECQELAIKNVMAITHYRDSRASSGIKA
jgi:hypothetical protein